MPARRFFALIEARRAQKAQERQDEAMIAFIPLGGRDYFEQVMEFFRQRSPDISRWEGPDPVEKPIQVSQSQGLEGTDAANAMRMMFK